MKHPTIRGLLWEATLAIAIGAGCAWLVVAVIVETLTGKDPTP